MPFCGGRRRRRGLLLIKRSHRRIELDNDFSILGAAIIRDTIEEPACYVSIPMT